MSITASGEHQGFPGTLSIGNEAMHQVVVELVRSADWARAVVLVNGHGGNVTAVDRAVGQLEAEGRRVLAWWPRVADGDPHAGNTETSLMPRSVPISSGSNVPSPARSPRRPSWCAEACAALSPNGVLGDPTAASAESGAELLARLADDLARAVDEWLA